MKMKMKEIKEAIKEIIGKEIFIFIMCFYGFIAIAVIIGSVR